MARKFAAVVFSLGCVQASPLMALGLGEMSLGSYLNEPLRAEVDLLNVEGLHADQIKIRLATADDFKRMGVDRAYFLTSISFDVEIDDSGRGRIVLTSEDPVLEPYLDFIVEARWPSGRLLREYTVLVDPPVFESVPVVSASERVAEVEQTPAPAKKKTTEVTTSGTRVEIGRSDLAPGEMPRRDFNATTSPAPIAGSRYMIHRDDTLWTIASRARPQGASVNQTMLDIQRLNPDAFIGGNINQIKAGYIIYLPTEADISSVDQAAAQREVLEQNEAWREGRASEPDYGSGPSLRISAEEPDAGAESGAATAGGDGAATAAGAANAALEDLDKSELARAELEDRLVAMEQQVETLERIVALKDDQIAALQGVLAEEQAETELVEDEAGMLLDELVGEADSMEQGPAGTGDQPAAEAGAAVDEVVTEVEVEVVEPAPAPAVETPAPEPAVVAPAPEQAAQKSGGIMDYLWYIVAAIVVLGGLLFLRRGKSGDGEAVPEAESGQPDAFANVTLTEQAVELEEPAPQQATPADVAAEEIEAEGPVIAQGERGYGQRKHDEYASDVEANDALAEADIYIAYGRYPQAIDLLRNALVNDPGNTAYRLKLLQLYTETGDRAAAEQQLSDLESMGDAASLAEARRLLSGAPAEFAPVEAEPRSALFEDSGESLEAEFSGLEIEEPGAAEPVAEDLDLSADFEQAGVDTDQDEEDLVIAAESNGLSTKLDLARAYMDMGDDDGARQILEEVAAEGSEELQAEARELLDRLG